MGLGIKVEVTALSEPTETVEVTCSKCGSKLRLTRLKEWAKVWPGEHGVETEQHCPVCGQSACEEKPKGKVKKRQEINFFSFFKEVI